MLWALNVNAWIWSVFMYTKDERAGVLYSSIEHGRLLQAFVWHKAFEQSMLSMLYMVKLSRHKVTMVTYFV